MTDLPVEAQALQNTPFFADLSQEDLAGVAKVGVPTTFDAGQTIVAQGDTADGMYVVIDGTAEVDVGGRFHRLGPGDFFGEMALIAPGRRMATVRAADAVRALKIPAEEFRSFLMGHPAVALSMLRALAERLREVEQRIDAWMAT
jgi:CRP-like cAMP-binding protein